MNEELNRETQKVLSDGEKIQNLVGSEGWNLAKAKLFKKLAALDSLVNIPMKGLDANRISQEVETRAGAISLVLEWIRDIEGEAESSAHQHEVLIKIKEDSVITYFP